MYYQLITTTSKYPPNCLELRAFATPEDLKQAQDLAIVNQITIRPNSVYVAGIGCHWSPGAWQKVVDMVQYTNEHGICCWLNEFPDSCIAMPYEGIGNMRDSACLAALDAGFEWILLTDNDVLPEPDLLAKLINWGMPVVVPTIIDHDRGALLSSPKYPYGTGLRKAKWTCLSCILIWTRVLNCFPNGTLFTTLITEDEFARRLIHYGHRIFIDTNMELKTARNPAYFGGLETRIDKMAYFEKIDMARKSKPNRKPIDQEDTREMYLPKVLSEVLEKPKVEDTTSAVENTAVAVENTVVEERLCDLEM